MIHNMDAWKIIQRQEDNVLEGQKNAERERRVNPYLGEVWYDALQVTDMKRKCYGGTGDFVTSTTRCRSGSPH